MQKKGKSKRKTVARECFETACLHTWLTAVFPTATETEKTLFAMRWRHFLKREGIHWSSARGWYTDGLGRYLDDFRHMFLRWRFMDLLCGTTWMTGVVPFYKKNKRYRLFIRILSTEKRLAKNILQLVERSPFLGVVTRNAAGDIFFPDLLPASALTICAFIHGQRRSFLSEGRTNTSRVADCAPSRQRPSSLSISTPLPDEACTNSPFPM